MKNLLFGYPQVLLCLALESILREAFSTTYPSNAFAGSRRKLGVSEFKPQKPGCKGVAAEFWPLSGESA